MNIKLKIQYNLEKTRKGDENYNGSVINPTSVITKKFSVKGDVILW